MLRSRSSSLPFPVSSDFFNILKRAGDSFFNMMAQVFNMMLDNWSGSGASEVLMSFSTLCNQAGVVVSGDTSELLL